MLVMSSLSSANESCSSDRSGSTASDLSSTSGLYPSGDVPPPPPLPPPPPPPAAPPPLPAVSTSGRKKRRVRSFFWKTIPEEKVRGKPNIWTMPVQQQQYQIDVRSVEELFGQQEEGGVGGRGATTTAGMVTQVSRSRSFKESSKEEISILDSKRGMNVGIFLKQFKKSNRSIVEDIRRGDGKLYGAELLKDLLKLLPDADEIKKLQAFKGDPDKLTLVDSFMYLLIQVPRLEVRIEAMVLSEEFMPSCAVMSHEIHVVRVATQALMSCEELHAILHLVLQAGNIMNAGGYAGNAVGFKLSSLLSLADTKANKPGMNLLHFVAMEAKKKDEKLLKFPEKLVDVQSAARISAENIEVEFSSLYVRIKTLEEKVQGDPELLLQWETFLQSSAQALQDLKRRRLDLRKEGNALIDFFCEDKDTFKLDECFRIFQDFCIKFKKAVKDNADRDQKEAARQRRLKELEEKRFAWSSEDHKGIFGRSSSENDVEMLTKEGLMDFFQQRSKSPHSPLGRSSSARRHRHTMTSIADRELQGYLELFGASDDYSKFNSLPRSGRTHQRKTTPWILTQGDDRELGYNRELPSARANTEPLSPLARFSSSGQNTDEDQCNNNSYACVSEGGHLPHTFSDFHNPAINGHMNVSVEKHTLVLGPQAFDLPSPNNNSNHMHLVNQGDVEVTDLEKDKCSLSGSLDLDKYPGGLEGVEPKGEVRQMDRNQEENSTVSSTTCDTPLPLDTPISNRKPVFNILDCTEADCSVTLDYSEVESSSLSKEGLHIRTGDCSEDQENPHHLSCPLPYNELSVDAASATLPEWEMESCDTTVAKQAGVKDPQGGSRKPLRTNSKGRKCGSASGSGVRTLTSSESQGMRKVVPITRLTRTGSRKQADSEDLRQPLREQSTPPRGRSEKTARPPRHSSLPPDESKSQKVGGLTGSISRCPCDPIQRKTSVNKPSAKPLRNIQKPAPEEKMCRSTMRALAQAQVQGGTSSENGSSQVPASKTLPDVPSFARNTVASSSRTKKEPAAQSTPSHVPSFLNRQTSIRQTRSGQTVHNSEERPQGTTLRRVHSVRADSRSTCRSQTPPPAREDVRKNFSDKSRDVVTPSKSAKPSWK
ncbi:FH2 domain-containing protein 1 isoform X2 [Dunckerocampus dactyliophorus]|uniref:FH2 domain-containing protein 1 isoform X2 n=1 Tax=Dunckerocampus dactyliophorus TaxID=161453 RepID=UPI002406E482|nr:FH2 domain-containing protein 1 isoform X2 [Dunckerocampus dactyliophorus]